ncbi:hypothetical protein [Streptomyces sp. NBC_01363]|uniref:hypothetical protein n=1 Tax=Streptomyces sp. NBC_01363 TaxID=2903840 RepID=UPI002252A2FE|nr:hypothetical protein [Streptomyces sp. NBC_01363]MCX4734300.1 hypothetical protein [Streptomyces sp. NBC_01363]
MMCDCCQQPMTPEESKSVDIPGATGPGITIHLHKWPCSLPAASRPRPYPHERLY